MSSKLSKPPGEQPKRRVYVPTKKRKRLKESSCADNKNTKGTDRNVDVPVIDNVSGNIAPLLLQAVKSQKKFISLKHQLSQKDGILNNPAGNHDAISESANKVNRSGPTLVQEAILQRMDSIQQNPGPLHEQLQDTENTCKLLLEAIDKESTDVPTTMIDTDDLPMNCAIGCLDFLMDLLSDQTCKIILRNAALCVIRALSQHRHDCRAVFTTKVKIFVDSVGDADEHLRMNANRKTGNRDHVVMYQRYALKFLHDLSDRFDSIQPKLVIAGRYLEEQKGISLYSGSHSSLRRNTNGDMIELRKIRDKALLFAEKEMARVNKVLKILDSCFEILVPRFGHKFHSHEPLDDNTFPPESSKDDTETDSLIVEDDGGEDTDDDIDWEDGDENKNQTQSTNINCVQTEKDANVNGEDRLAMVERTMAVMKQSGALRNDGTLEVEFGAKSHASDPLHGTATEPSSHDIIEEKESKEKISKCVEFLSKKLDKLSLWIDALLSADNMTDASRIRSSSNHYNKQGISSVVLLPVSIRKKKGITTRMLIDTKNTIARALSAEATMKRTHTYNIEDTEGEVLDSKHQPAESNRKKIETAKASIQPWQEALGVKQTDTISVTASVPTYGQTKKFCKGRLQIKLRNP